MLYKNIGSQKLVVFVYDIVADTPKTGDAANITAQISKDGGVCTATNDTNPTELDAVNAPGTYIFDLSQAETNAELVVVSASSTTSNITIELVVVYTAGTDIRYIEGNSQTSIDLQDFVDTCYNPISHKITGVSVVDTTTTNTDMITSAIVNTACDVALADYDGPTHTEMTNEHTVIVNDTNELQLNQGDWATATGFSTLEVADVNAACDAALADYDGPTNTELEARTLVSAEYGNLANQTVIVEDTNELQLNQGDWATATGFSTLEVADVNAACDASLVDYDGPTNTELEARTLVSAEYGTLANQTVIVEDTNELQTNQGDWATATGFSTHSSNDVAVAIQASTSDGVTWEDIFAFMLSKTKGQINKVGDVYSYRNQANDATLFTLTEAGNNRIPS